MAWDDIHFCQVSPHPQDLSQTILEMLIHDSTYLLWHSLAHIDAYGPKSTHARARDDVSKPVTEKPFDNGSVAESAVGSAPITQPGEAHVKPESVHNADPATKEHSVV